MAGRSDQASAHVWDPNRSHIRVELRGITTEAHVGLHAWERHKERPSRLIVDVEMLAPTEGALAGGAPLIDYDDVRAAIKSWPARAHTDLLETLAEELVALCLAIPAVQACRVSVRKPDIFNEVAEAGVELFRVRGG
jgi:7,8-dihydroneopterin aldolase/epimerase/oxygenase